MEEYMKEKEVDRRENVLYQNRKIAKAKQENRKAPDYH